MSRSTLAVQADPVDLHSGGTVPPLQPSTTYARDERYNLVRARTEYSRDDNPTYAPAEALIARLEGGSEALLFGSGMAGMTALFRALERGERIVAPTRMYYGTVLWLKRFSKRRGVELGWFDPAQPGSLERALQEKARLVWVETPANPTWELTDIARAAELAHAAGARLAVDSTVSSPVLTQPLALGADIVFHSASKYLNGHSDVLAGVLVTQERDALWEAVRFERRHSGAVLGPFEAWLLLRGLRTLFLRVKRSSQSALALATHFEHHPQLERVLYPGLPSHPGHAVAQRQMDGGFGGMLSLLVKGGAQAAIEVACHTRVWVSATSLGGVESLIEHRKTVEGPHSSIPDNLLRLSVGLEDPQDLIADLERALAVDGGAGRKRR